VQVARAPYPAGALAFVTPHQRLGGGGGV